MQTQRSGDAAAWTPLLTVRPPSRGSFPCAGLWSHRERTSCDESCVKRLTQAACLENHALEIFLEFDPSPRGTLHTQVMSGASYKLSPWRSKD